jgi:deoxypyrimidine-specific 5' nucleotidase type C protein (NT5C)
MLGKKLHIAVDLDDVVLDFMPSVMETFYREYGERPEFDGSWGARTTEFYKHPLLLASGYKSWWDWLRDRDWLWSTFGAVPGAIGGIKQLRAAGHYVECVTSKPEWAEYNVWKWLGKWRPAFHRVTVVTNGQCKADFTAADVIVDDKMENCQAFMERGRQAIYFSTGPHDNYTGQIAWNWGHVIDHIEEIWNDVKSPTTTL